jgi:acyl carrier protein
MSTLRTVQDMLVEEFGVTRDQVHAGARLDELGVDSLATIEFLFLLEDRFGLQAPEPPAAVATVGDIAAHIDFLLAKQRNRSPVGTR